MIFYILDQRIPIFLKDEIDYATPEAAIDLLLTNKYEFISLKSHHRIFFRKRVNENLEYRFATQNGPLFSFSKALLLEDIV